MILKNINLLIHENNTSGFLNNIQNKILFRINKAIHVDGSLILSFLIILLYTIYKIFRIKNRFFSVNEDTFGYDIFSNNLNNVKIFINELNQIEKKYGIQRNEFTEDSQNIELLKTEITNFSCENIYYTKIESELMCIYNWIEILIIIQMIIILNLLFDDKIDLQQFKSLNDLTKFKSDKYFTLIKIFKSNMNYFQNQIPAICKHIAKHDMDLEISLNIFNEKINDEFERYIYNSINWK